MQLFQWCGDKPVCGRWSVIGLRPHSADGDRCHLYFIWCLHLHRMYCHAILVMKSLNLFVEKDQRITIKISVKPDNVLHCKKCSKITSKCPKLPTMPNCPWSIEERISEHAEVHSTPCVVPPLIELSCLGHHLPNGIRLIKSDYPCLFASSWK